MSRPIAADALEKDGWMMHRTVQVDKNIMSYETKKPTDFPTIEPERKTGEWVVTKTERAWNCAEYPTEVTCSNCGYVEVYSRKYNFCPNCGADMREGAEQE